MFNSALEQFEILSFLYVIPSAVWLRVDKLMKILEQVHKRVDTNGAYSITDLNDIDSALTKFLNLHECFTPEANKSSRATLKIVKISKFRIFYKKYEAIFNSIKKTGKLSGADLIRLKQLLVEMLRLQDEYKCMPPYAEAEIRDFLASITTKKKAK